MAYNPASLAEPERPEKGPGYPEWVFLATRAYVSDRRNATTAQCTQPHPQRRPHPSLPLCRRPSCHLPPLRALPGRENQFDYNPAIIFSRDDLILFAGGFAIQDCDYFIYKAHSTNPSLHRIPEPDPYGFHHAGLVCYGGDHFAVAALFHEYEYKTRTYRLSVFASSTGVWASRLLPLEPSQALPKPEELHFTPTKVIPLNGSFLGWVDLFGGILLCDVLADDDSVLRYIPLPEPLPGNEGISDEGELSFFRDVCGCEEWIKCVEMEYRDVGAAPAIIAHASFALAPHEWTAVTSIRKLDWSHCWERINTLDIGDITVAEHFDESLDVLPELCENGKPSLKKLPIGIPTLCEHNSVLYLMSKLTHVDLNGWVVAVDLTPDRRSWKRWLRFLLWIPLVS